MSLVPTFKFGEIDLCDYPFAVRFGHDRGTPEAVVESIQSDLRDGSLTSVTRYDNRTVTIPVLIEGATMLDLAEFEALLVAEAMKERNEFIFNPGDAFSVDSVFDTFTADLRPEYSDDRDMALVRFYTLTFQARPWPRSATKVITPAVAAVAPTLVDNGSATTNWSADGGTLSTASGAVVNTYIPTVGGGVINTVTKSLTRVFPTPLATSDKFISIDWKATNAPDQVGLLIPSYSASLSEVRRLPGATAGYLRSWFKIPDDNLSISSLRFLIRHAKSTAPSATLSIDLVQIANAIPAVGTARQQIATIDPGGSVTAEGDVIVEHATAGLGPTIVYSHPARGGQAPPLRPWLAASDAVTPDSGRVSGSFHALTGNSTFNIPAPSIPEGDVQLWALIGSSSGTGSATIQWGASSVMGSTVVGDVLIGQTAINFATSGAWFLAPIARIALPVAHIGPAGYVQIGLQKVAGTPTVQLDEAWLFGMDEGRLTVLDCGTGTPAVGSIHNRLRVTAPSLETPNGRIEVATAADWSDAITPNSDKVLCDQVGHRFDADGSLIFTVTAGPSTAASVSLEHYPRWHSNAGTP